MIDYLENVNDRTYKEILPIVSEIRNNLSCSYCGGNKYNESECIYCETKSEKLEVLLNSLNKKLQRYSEIVENIGEIDMPCNDMFNLLSSLEQIEIKSINVLLERYNYREKYQNLKNNTFNKINVFDTQLSAMDISIIQNEVYNSKTSLNIGKAFNFFVRNALSKKQNISYEDFCELVRRYVIWEAKLFNSNAKCEIVPDDRKEKEAHVIQLGGQLYENISLSEIGIKELYKGNSYHVLITIYHELTHILQFKSSREIGMIEEIKDEILTNILDDYYEDNYDRVFFELEARYYGLIEAIKSLEKIGIVVKKEGYIENEIKYLESHINDKIRIFNGKEINIDDLFSNFIIDKPELFERYPQLNILYKINNNKVYPKSLEELKSDYENILNNPNIDEKNKNIYKIVYSKYINDNSKKII